jgi:hypothetical protein
MRVFTFHSFRQSHSENGDIVPRQLPSPLISIHNSRWSWYVPFVDKGWLNKPGNKMNIISSLAPWAYCSFRLKRSVTLLCMNTVQLYWFATWAVMHCPSATQSFLFRCRWTLFANFYRRARLYHWANPAPNNITMFLEFKMTMAKSHLFPPPPQIQILVVISGY